jgi:exopolyphosphatase/guanosine-5'-triphosphate,3'-diphosphate pyrophosphatase
MSPDLLAPTRHPGRRPDTDVAVTPETHRVAAIDVGSNAIRYVTAEISSTGGYREIEAERLSVRLGKDVFTRERRFTKETMDAGVAALSRIRRRIDDLGIAHYRAVATSAVRESRNGGAFVERVRRESGIHLETISGSEEARLVWIAVQSRIDLGRYRWFTMDLGGGSVEISVVDKDGILWSESHTLGSVRLLQAFQENRAPGSGTDYQELLERYVHVLKVPSAVREWAPAGAIATGGNIDALAALVGAPRDEAGVARLTMDDLRKVTRRLADLTYEQRIARLGLREDRADVILPAAVVYERVASLAGAQELLVPGVGVKEGLVLDLVDELWHHAEHSDRREQEIRAAAIALGRRFQFDEAHGLHVAALSLALFDQLQELHGLGNKERNLLLAGAILHDIGQFVSYGRHHKHSMYLIENSELPEVSPTDIQLIALLARYHRRAEPRTGHPEFDALPADERETVRKLAALLRIADALDREHTSRVQSLSAYDRDGGVALHLTTRGSPVLEEWALRKKGRMFETVFGKALTVTTESS